MFSSGNTSHTLALVAEQSRTPSNAGLESVKACPPPPPLEVVPELVPPVLETLAVSPVLDAPPVLELWLAVKDPLVLVVGAPVVPVAVVPPTVWLPTVVIEPPVTLVSPLVAV